METQPDQTHADFESLKNVARSVLRCTADADDVVQRAWMEAAQSHSAPTESRQGWLGGIVKMLARSEARDRSRRKEREVRSARAEAIHEDPLARASQTETIEAVRAAVQGLDEPHRSVIQLHCFDGLSTKDIATRMEVSQASVQRYLRTANESLRTKLRATYQDSDRALGMVLIGSFSWERSDLKSAAVAAKAGSMGLGLLAMTKWTLAALVLIAGLVAVIRPWNSGGQVEALPGIERDAELAELDAAAKEDLTLKSGAAADGQRDSLAGAAEAETTQVDGPEPASSSALPAADSALTSTIQELLVIDPTGTPVPGAEIFFPSPGAETLLGSTDSDGRARVDFKGLTGESLMRNSDAPYVKVFARTPGYADTHCYVVQQELADRPLMTLPFLSAPMQVTGRVLKPDGTPAVGALIERNFLSKRDGRLSPEVRIDGDGRSYEYRRYQAIADDRGEFVLTGLPQVLHTLEVTAEGFAAASEVVAFEDDEEPDCTIELVLAGTITGKVLDVDGAPAVGANVYVAPRNRSNVAPIHVVTDDAGQFRAESVAPGPTTILTGFVDARASKVVLVEGGEELVVELQMEKLKRFEVRVVDEEGEPLEGYFVGAESDSHRWASERALTDEDGVAFVDEFPSEPMVLMVFPPRAPIFLTTQRLEKPVADGRVEIVSPRDYESLGVASGLLRIDDAIPPPGCRMIAKVSGLSVSRRVMVDPVTGAFSLDELPAGKYELSAKIPPNMRIWLDTIELDGVDADLGTLNAPPMGTLAIDWRWPKDEAGSYRIRQMYHLHDTPGFTMLTIAEGSGAPVDELEVVPGSYAFIIAGADGKSLQQQAVVVRPGVRQSCLLGPERQFSAIVDLELEGTAPTTLPIQVYAAAIDDHAAFDALKPDELAALTNSANLRDTVTAEQGWNGAFLVPFTMDTTHRWILVTEWPEGQVQRMPLGRARARAAVATTFRLGAGGWELTKEWGK